MEVKIENIDDEQFRQDLTKALAGSVVGSMVMRILENASSDYKVKEAIEGIMRNVMADQAREIIANNQEFQNKLRVKVESLLSDELIDDLVSKIKVDRY